jgi:RNA polymerase sigma factor (sigma-70 family)
MEVSALKFSGGIGLHGRSPLLRVQSDERLVALIRRGNTGAFEVLVSRYESRLLAFCRHMVGTREDAEDVLQEVMAAAYNALLADDRPVNARPWLYRIARNRSLNHLRRVSAVGVDSMDIHLAEFGASTADKAHRREEFRLLVADIQALPETQRTALVLREMDALSYDQIAEAMETTVPSVKSLLVRARVGLAEAAEARMLSCDEVRDELGEVAEGLKRKLSPPVRRHIRTCTRCETFRVQLRETNKALAAVLPLGPLVIVKKLLLGHLGHHAGSTAAGSGASAGVAGSTVAGGGGTLFGGSGIISAGVGAIATKAAAGLAAAALLTAGAVEVSHHGGRLRRSHHTAGSAAVSYSAHVPAVPATGGASLAAQLPGGSAGGSIGPLPQGSKHRGAAKASHDASGRRRHALKHAADKGGTTPAAPSTTTPLSTTPTVPATTTSTTKPPETTSGDSGPGRTQTQTVPTVLPDPPSGSSTVPVPPSPPSGPGTTTSPPGMTPPTTTGTSTASAPTTTTPTSTGTSTAAVAGGLPTRTTGTSTDATPPASG